ncbi:MAG: diaminopimelate decarboxylase [Bacteroidaceae bacterium]|nr:diaminopimelate decarboxylase [Bacteroidaceae bacterium]
MVKRLLQDLEGRFESLKTPFYYYDTDLLAETLSAIKNETDKRDGWHLHYAVKACANAKVLRQIQRAGFGADCVSGGEIRACLENGFPASEIVYAGVGKSDWEIELALEAGIQYFNVESIPELEVIAEIATRMNRVANVSFRINPNVGAHTHVNITTGLAENKFGIAKEDMLHVIRVAQAMPSVRFVGLHFHIGSQILQMDDFEALCHRINELQDQLEASGITEVHNINVGGGLGIDYQNPDGTPIPDFKSYFETYAKHLKLRPGQRLHFELGRAVTGQCGSLITRCLYVKQAKAKQFAIVDAGMTELLRPALYGALHQIQNLSAGQGTLDGVQQADGDGRQAAVKYDIVGPICESSDTFAKDFLLPETRRGDLLAIRSAGAYGETMASQYNCRELPKAYTTEEILH